MSSALPLLISLLLASTSTHNEPRQVSSGHVTDPQGRFSTKAYDPALNGMEQVDAALQTAKAGGKTVLVMMGGNWCHDSAALANMLANSRFAGLMSSKYHIIHVDVGVPQIGNGRNLDVARRFGVSRVKNTPLLLVLSQDGKRLNSVKDARSWRNAASRSEDAVFSYFANLHID